MEAQFFLMKQSVHFSKIIKGIIKNRKQLQKITTSAKRTFLRSINDHKELNMKIENKGIFFINCSFF